MVKGFWLTLTKLAGKVSPSKLKEAVTGREPLTDTKPEHKGVTWYLKFVPWNKAPRDSRVPNPNAILNVPDFDIVNIQGIPKYAVNRMSRRRDGFNFPPEHNNLMMIAHRKVP